jgi:hypothetical protein
MKLLFLLQKKHWRNIYKNNVGKKLKKNLNKKEKKDRNKTEKNKK